MQIFLSWSKPRSKAAALAFHSWIPDVLQNVKTWMSAEDISSGASWNLEIRRALGESEFGIIFVTRENLKSEWLMFESGALAKHVETSRVIPLIVDDGLQIEALPGPLSQLQARVLDKSNAQRIVHEVNALTKAPLEAQRVQRCFEAHWKTLEDQLSQLPSADGDLPQITSDELILEIYSMVRGIKRQQSTPLQMRSPLADPPYMPSKVELENMEANLFEIAGALHLDFPDLAKLRNAYLRLVENAGKQVLVELQGGKDIIVNRDGDFIDVSELRRSHD